MRYLNILKNQWLVSRAWMLSTLVFMGMAVFLVLALIRSSMSTPVRLVPYEYAANNNYVTVTSDAMADKESYLTDIAIADVTNFTTWTNRTIVRQYSRFVNRMTPRLYTESGRMLLDKAEQIKTTEEAQTFFVERTSISKDGNTVLIVGVLRMYQGTVVTNTLNMSYMLEYNSRNGLPLISSFKSEQVNK